MQVVVRDSYYDDPVGIVLTCTYLASRTIGVAIPYWKMTAWWVRAKGAMCFEQRWIFSTPSILPFVHPPSRLHRGLKTVLELVANNLIYLLWICLALGGLHYLPYKESQHFVLAASQLVELLRIRRD